jgi:Uncharacterized protein conserved in bacteria
MPTQQYWKEFINEYPKYKEKSYTAWQFGADPDELAELVISGKKTLTCSSLKEYELENESLPKAGELSIVLGADDTPKCIIECTKVYTNFLKMPTKNSLIKKARATGLYRIGDRHTLISLAGCILKWVSNLTRTKK